MQSMILNQLVYHGEVGLEAVNCKCSFEKILKNLTKLTKQTLLWS